MKKTITTTLLALLSLSSPAMAGEVQDSFRVSLSIEPMCVLAVGDDIEATAYQDPHGTLTTFEQMSTQIEMTCNQGLPYQVELPGVDEGGWTAMTHQDGTTHLPVRLIKREGERFIGTGKPQTLRIDVDLTDSHTQKIGVYELEQTIKLVY